MDAPRILQRHYRTHQSPLPEAVTLQELLAADEAFVITVPKDDDPADHGTDILWAGYQRRWLWIADYGNDISHHLDVEFRSFNEQPTAGPAWDADKLLLADRYRIDSVEKLKSEFQALGYRFLSRKEAKAQMERGFDAQFGKRART